MKGRFMTTEVVGNAQVFVVIREIETGKEYGLRIEVSDPMLFISSSQVANPYFSLEGVEVLNETIELEEMRNRLNG